MTSDKTSDKPELSHRPLMHLQQDPVLAQLLLRHPLAQVKAAESAFQTLVRSIVGQQLSVKVARTISDRVGAATAQFDPAQLAALDPADLRALGMSWSKVRTVQALAAAQLSGQLDVEHLQQLDDEAVITALVQFPGIGRWTAEMFLMSGLGRADVFSFGDLGLRRALERLYPDQDHAAVVARWRPYRTYAARLLWNSLDTTDCDLNLVQNAVKEGQQG